MDKQIICKDANGKEYSVGIEDINFRPAVYGVVIQDNKVLLSKQWDGYDFPGGGIDIDETIEDALKREFMEETGLEVEVVQLIECKDSFYWSIVRKVPFHGIQMYYICRVVGGEIGIDNIDEHEKQYMEMPEWVQLSEISKVKMYNLMDNQSIINKALAAK